MQRNWFRDKYYQNSLRLLCARTVQSTARARKKTHTQNYTTHSIIMKLRKLSLMTSRVFMAWCAMRSVHLCCHFHSQTHAYVVTRWWRSLQINRNIGIIAWYEADKRNCYILINAQSYSHRLCRWPTQWTSPVRALSFIIISSGRWSENTLYLFSLPPATFSMWTALNIQKRRWCFNF